MTEGMKFISEVPKEYGTCVSMTTYQDRIYVAFQYCVGYIDPMSRPNKIIPIKFKQEN